MPGQPLIPTATHPIMSALMRSKGCEPRDMYWFFDDFFDFTADAGNDKWVSAEDAGAHTQAGGDAAGGYVLLTTSDTADEGTTVSTAFENWIFNTTKRLGFEARFKYGETTLGNASVAIGLSDTVTVEILQDDGTGLAASFDGAAFYKAEDSAYWRFGSSNAATQVACQSDAVDDFEICGGVTLQWIRAGFEYDFNDGVTGHINAWLYDETNDIMYTVPEQDITISGLEEMHLFMSVKGHNSSEATAFYCDYIQVSQDR